MTIVKAVAGSRLFGLSTPSSDWDYKGIFQESLENIVLQKDRETIVTTTGGKGKNTKDDTDVEMKELRKFIKDCINGQTYALELLYTPKEMIIETSPQWEFIQANRDKLRTDNLKPFVGYAFSQAGKYTLRGQRLKELEDFESWLASKPTKDRLQDYAHEIVDTEMVFNSSFPHRNGHTEYRTHACGMIFQHGSFVQECLVKVRRRLKEYGHRAKKAKLETADWKAYSHAFRLLYEWEQLLTEGLLTFPVKNTEYILQVKKGELDLEIVQEYLFEEFTRIQQIPDTLSKPDTEFWTDWLLAQYI